MKLIVYKCSFISQRIRPSPQFDMTPPVQDESDIAGLAPSFHSAL